MGTGGNRNTEREAENNLSLPHLTQGREKEDLNDTTDALPLLLQSLGTFMFPCLIQSDCLHLSETSMSSPTLNNVLIFLTRYHVDSNLGSLTSRVEFPVFGEVQLPLDGDSMLIPVKGKNIS